MNEVISGGRQKWMSKSFFLLRYTILNGMDDEGWMEGILPLYKPAGMTSHDCVFKLRKILKTKKVGHTGTLDPDVTGVFQFVLVEQQRLLNI